jgi:uncharacterized membrane protein YhhN
MADDSFTATESKSTPWGKYIILIIVGACVMLGGNFVGIPYAMRLGITVGIMVLGVLVIKASTPSEDTKF